MSLPHDTKFHNCTDSHTDQNVYRSLFLYYCKNTNTFIMCECEGCSWNFLLMSVTGSNVYPKVNRFECPAASPGWNWCYWKISLATILWVPRYCSAVMDSYPGASPQGSTTMIVCCSPMQNLIKTDESEKENISYFINFLHLRYVL